MEVSKVRRAIEEIAAGKMVIVLDDKDRENEGDLVMAADKVTPEAINFMTKYARGLVCMPMQSADFDRLGISMMVENNESAFETGFGVSIGAAVGMTTGISAADRALTIRTAANPRSRRQDIVKPGHIFPLRAKKGGVFTRQGHTEAGVDLARLAGCAPAAVICEVMCENGEMAKEKDLKQFAKRHNLTMISVDEIVAYRLSTEPLVTGEAEARLPTEYGSNMAILIYHSFLDAHEWPVVVSGNLEKIEQPLVRLHSACFTGDLLGSCRCDCGAQLKQSLTLIAEQGGILIYLPQEGRGIGLTNKIKAYALQDQGLDTVEANNALGFSADLREYVIAAKILQNLGVNRLRLLSNNPNKVKALVKYGLIVSERVPLNIKPCNDNAAYLQVKKQKLGHLLNLEHDGEL